MRSWRGSWMRLSEGQEQEKTEGLRVATVREYGGLEKTEGLRVATVREYGGLEKTEGLRVATVREYGGLESAITGAPGVQAPPGGIRREPAGFSISRTENKGL
ncbi:hypothetical protein, partial [Methanoculleus sp.]|uniref:hypothetical protein n=1 Tax=Methanoculleus sp. TaxID=90427 RepID=UPI0026251CA8